MAGLEIEECRDRGVDSQDKVGSVCIYMCVCIYEYVSEQKIDLY